MAGQLNAASNRPTLSIQMAASSPQIAYNGRLKPLVDSLCSEFPPREPADWAQPVKLDCRCADCRQLQSFAEEPAQKVYRFRVRKDRRQHLHQTIESHQMDMTHQTERKGSPQTLVCTKTRRSFQKRCQQHAEDLGRFKTLIAIVANLPKELQSLTDRMRQAICRGPRPSGPRRSKTSGSVRLERHSCCGM